jgi:hypothetical protein
MTANRGDVVLVDYPYTAGGAKVRPYVGLGRFGRPQAFRRANGLRKGS